MWQEIIVYIIGFLTLIHIIRNIYNFFLKCINSQNKCFHCTGCAAREKLTVKK